MLTVYSYFISLLESFQMCRTISCSEYLLPIRFNDLIEYQTSLWFE